MRTFQSVFHEEWQHLHDPHVRALAWVLTSPGLLNRNASLWHDQVAELSFPDKESLRAWLTQLDQHPTELHDTLSLHSNRRLGLYENLLGFYLKREGLLYAHGLQINHDAIHTVGEFDFLLYQPNGLLHWEFATKFYLLDASGEPQRELSLHDYMGPNLADNFALKLKKIFRQQLALPHHPAAQKVLLQKLLLQRQCLKAGCFIVKLPALNP